MVDGGWDGGSNRERRDGSRVHPVVIQRRGEAIRFDGRKARIAASAPSGQMGGRLESSDGVEGGRCLMKQRGFEPERRRG